jgi:hypothetical protein
MKREKEKRKEERGNGRLRKGDKYPIVSKCQRVF